MGLGKASVYKYISEYFPDDVGAAGGLVGTLGALGGFFLPLAFGYLETWTGHPESCFSVMLFLVLGCLLWLHLVVTGLRRATAPRLAPKRWARSTMWPGRAPERPLPLCLRTLGRVPNLPRWARLSKAQAPRRESTEERAGTQADGRNIRKPTRR